MVLFHAGMPGFAGGYVGVDIFFVISGYLITGILLSDIDGGRYTIGRFYERRIRRIFPALAVVVLACLLVGFVILMPDEYANLARSAAAVALFCSNFYFWRSVNYFDNAQSFQPLLHTWSLAVEEQFYILFPPLLAWLARWRARLMPVLVTVALLSLALAAVLVFRKQSATFYLPFTRAWELLAGAILAARPLWPAASERLRGAASAVGLLLALAPVALYDEHTLFPGLAALPPVLGAALVIWGNERAITATGRLLATAPMTFVGRISYSLYLWHVPVFAVAVYLLGGKLTTGQAVAATATAVALAWLSYRFVESPFRAGATTTRWRPATVGVLAMVAALGLSGAIVVAKGWPARLDERGRALVEAAGDEARFHRECLSVGDTIVSPARACRLGAPNAPPTALLWGDSHAMVTATPMEIAAVRAGASFLFAASADCPIGLGFEIDPRWTASVTSAPAYRFCGRYNREMLQVALQTPTIRRIVLSSRWSNWRIGEPGNPVEGAVDVRLRDDRGVAGSMADNAAIFQRGFERLVATLRAAGKEVVIVGPLPEPSFHVPQRLFIERFGWTGASTPITAESYRRRHRRILAMFEPLRGWNGVSFIWPADLLCQRDVCPIEERGRAAFFDHNHLSLRAARRTASLYDPMFR